MKASSFRSHVSPDCLWCTVKLSRVLSRAAFGQFGLVSKTPHDHGLARELSSLDFTSLMYSSVVAQFSRFTPSVQPRAQMLKSGGGVEENKKQNETHADSQGYPKKWNKAHSCQGTAGNGGQANVK